MPITPHSEPQKWSALGKPIVFAFDFEKDKPVDLASFSGLTFRIGTGAYQDKLVLDVDSIVDAQGLPLFGVNLGSYYYLVSKPSDTLLYPEAVTLVDVAGLEFETIGERWCMVFDVDYYASGAESLTGETVSIFSLAAWQALEPQYELYVNDELVSTPFDVEDLETGKRLVQVNSELFSQFDAPLPALQLGDNPTYYRKYRLDFGILGEFQTGKDKYVINAVINPVIPSCANNEPVWQFDLATLRCKYNAPRTSSEREARQKDVNPDSPTFGQFRDGGAYYLYDSNSTSCPITFYSKAYPQAFTKNNCGTNQAGSQVTYTVPAGAYSSTVSQAAADALAAADAAANGQAYANANGTCLLIRASIRIANQSIDYPDAFGGVYRVGDIYLDITANGQPYTPTGLVVNLEEIIDGVLQGVYTETTSQASKLLFSSYILENKSYDSDGDPIFLENKQIVVRPGSGYSLL